jgi:hypothetical protein
MTISTLANIDLLLIFYLIIFVGVLFACVEANDG